ncbi:MAG: hypothetical protein ABIA62_04355 [Candidatus Woesearchaeota archaeon]
MTQLDKYAKIAILSTLDEQKTLVDISTTWFDNKGRLYQPIIIKEIKKCSYLKQQGKKFYQADMKKLIENIVGEISLGENHKLAQQYQKELKNFYLTLGDYTQKVYLNFEVIKLLTKMDWQKAAELDMKLLIQLPFILRFMEYQNKEMANIFIQVMDLEEYVKLIEKLEIQYYHILKEKKQVDDWVECFNKLTKILPKMQKKGLTIFKKNVQAMKAFGG